MHLAPAPRIPKARWAYDPHLDPALHWAGKAERTSFEVDTVSLHVHERIDPLSILAAVRKGQGKGKSQGAARAVQPGLFDAPFENLPLRDAIDFYRHDKGWANRLIAGDSLLVMNSLLHKEHMAGAVQMVYIDPPYGIKYGSNFQPFVGKRDVKDRNDADLTREPEMIKAFRDTWELGIHSYLSYLRDRLLLARELLSDSGSVFVQISDENAHRIRMLMDEVFGCDNFCSEIIYRKTTGKGSVLLDSTCDYIIWYAKSKAKVKYNALNVERELAAENSICMVWEPNGEKRSMSRAEILSGKPQSTGKIFFPHPLTSARSGGASDVMGFEYQGIEYSPGSRTFSTDMQGLKHLSKSGRIHVIGSTMRFVRYFDDFPFMPINNVWDDTRQSGFADSKIYVVQTSSKAIERCLLMTTDPGELVLDPTCGSGTTAFVAEKWGRRWMTVDTSRVAIALARQRLMTASYDYYTLKYPHEGLKGGFLYRTVPHVTLKSIANNPEIDSIYERMHPAIEQALAALNAALRQHPPATPFEVAEGARKGQALSPAKMAADGLQEWEVPFEAPLAWPDALHAPLAAFHTARLAMQRQMDDAIARGAQHEALVDRPQVDKTRLRVSGPFTVEAVPFPSVQSLDEPAGPAQADASAARSGETLRQEEWRSALLKAGIRGKGGQTLRLADLDVLPIPCRHLHARGRLQGGEPVAVSFGPEYAPLEQQQVEAALQEAGTLFPRPQFLLFCAFSFDPEAAKNIDAQTGITALKVQMNADLLTHDLQKNKAANQSFWLMGQPDVTLQRTSSGQYVVQVGGFDYFNAATGELTSGSVKNIAMWALDTDYDGRSIFPRQVFFPLAGKGGGWEKLKKSIRAALDEDRLHAFAGATSLPFDAGAHKRIAVKIIDDRGIESLKVLALEEEQ